MLIMNGKLNNDSRPNQYRFISGNMDFFKLNLFGDEIMIDRIYEIITGKYIQKSHFELNKFQYDIIRNYAERHNMSIESVLNIQKNNIREIK